MPKNNNERLPDGSTPLHNEVRAGNVKTIKLLILQGTNFNITDAQGKTPLDYAPTEEIKEILISAMRVEQTLTYSNAEKYFNDLKKTYIKKESDKEKAIDILFSDPTIEDNIKEIVMEKIWNYNVNSNNTTVTPEIIAPVAAPAPITTTTSTEIAAEDNVRAPIPARFDTLIEPTSTSTDEKLSADVKKRLFNGEDPMKVMNSLEYYPNISEETIVELTNYICEYAFGTKLAGDIDLGL